MSAFDFLRWCFSDANHGIWTVLISGFACSGLRKLLLAARGIDA